MDLSVRCRADVYSATSVEGALEGQDPCPPGLFFAGLLLPVFEFCPAWGGGVSSELARLCEHRNSIPPALILSLGVFRCFVLTRKCLVPKY